jgi:PGDYG protein
MLNMNDVDLDSDPESVIATKRPIPVPVRFATEPGTVDTLEGPVAYEAGAAICRGVKGELWPVSGARFKSLYEPLPGTKPGGDGLYRKKPIKVRAKRILSDRFCVNVGAQHQPILGRAGDWLIQYSRRKRSIISDEVFRASYEVIAPESRLPR